MIPSFEEFLFPVLFVLMDGKPQHRDDLRESCVKYMGFSEEELRERINSGKKYKIVDRLQWATYYLQKAGLVFRPDHATDQITAEGKALIDSGVTKISRQFLRENFEAYRVFEKQTRNAAKLRLQEKKEKQKNKQDTKSIKKPNDSKKSIDKDVQSFVGALSSIGISKGVYITTSEFSSEALSYQTHGAVRCILIGGEMLAKLMIKFNVGVVTRNVFEIKDVDQEYLFTRLTQS